VSGNPAKELPKALMGGYSLKVRRKEALGIVQHAYTHFKVTVHAYFCDAISVPKIRNMKWVMLKDLDGYPMGRVDRQIADKVKQCNRT
jgi:A/G-specific adenine glycosylase